MQTYYNRLHKFMEFGIEKFRQVLHGRIRSRQLGMAVLTAVLICCNGIVSAQQGFWIWTSQQDALNAPVGSCYFRKKIELDNPATVELIAAGDDKFIVHVNGKQAGQGSGSQELTRLNLTPFVQDGDNLIAVQVINSTGETAAFACQIKVFEGATKTPRWIASDSSWKTLVNPISKWKMLELEDKTWDYAAEIGIVGTTLPWDANRIAQRKSKASTAENSSAKSTSATATTKVASSGSNKPSRFQVPDKFKVSKVLDDSAGSVIAIEFNEFGQLLVSQERGGLKLVDFNKRKADGSPEITTFCEQVNSCQGILPLNGKVFVIGYGPDGSGLYELVDTDRNGSADKVTALAKFKGEPGEHGPHGMILGTDGMIYVTVGNASGIDGEASSSSPAKHFYDIDLMPRQEDRGGHAAGVRAPGGTIVRISLDGSKKEIVASGLRNAYDLAVNSNGEIFFHDSDMEADTGTPWYRPTQVYQLTPGADYGWRSGWAKFPYYYLDCMPGICDTGRGSPTGGTFYDHVNFPIRYHGALFLGDWSEGRIIAVRMQRKGAGYQAEYEDFLTAQPLTVTDLTVGPDGALYFSTGGRETEGGIYRVSWEGGVPDSFSNFSDQLSKLVRQPQPQSAWGRQQLAKEKLTMGAQWQEMLQGIVGEQRNTTEYRIRALNLMMLYGPTPKLDSLTTLASDLDPAIRAKAAEIMGIKNSKTSESTLLAMLVDESSLVRTAAIQALLRMGSQPEWTELKQSLQSEDAIESLSARRLLESLPVKSWQEILTSEEQKLFCQGALALMTVEPSLENSYSVLARVSQFMDGFISDARFIDMLRVAEIALDRGDVDPGRINLFGQRIATEFPAGNGKLNREMSRLIAYLGDYGASDRIVEYLESQDHQLMDKLQVALNWQVFAEQLTSEQRLALIGFLEDSIVSINEVGQRQYADTALQAYLKHIDDADVKVILTKGANWPTAALEAFYRMPQGNLSENEVKQLIEIDQKLELRDDHAAEMCKLGIVALLGERGNDEAHAYLRDIWRNNELRRNDVAMGLAQKPDGPNWTYLVGSLAEVSDDTAREVIKQLGNVNRKPSEADHYRSLIVVAFRLRDQGGLTAIKLLEHWTGEKIDIPSSNWRDAVKVWSDWFSRQYPDAEPVKLEELDTYGQHSISRYLDFIEANPDKLSAARGQHVFAKALCTQCHRFDKQGDTLGPDLTSLARRFSKREALESIIFPSRVVSDQFSAHKLLTTDGQQFMGMLSETGDGAYIVVQANGEKVRIPKDNVDELERADISAMPSGLVDRLTEQEIGDLVAFLYKSTDPRFADDQSSRGEAR